ncbi:hypothetical protein CLOM_g20958 [Closterium sp. NIES-68]|nr:hypothetical protein CLOM_g20958 [Closterium sp. NIES-68]
MRMDSLRRVGAHRPQRGGREALQVRRITWPRSVALGRETQPTHISSWRLRKPVSLATRIRERQRLLKLEATVWHVKVPYP